MPKYFFNIRNGDDVADDTSGTELPDLDAARKQALGQARSRLAERIEKGQLLGNDEFSICNAAGRTLLTVTYRSALRFE